MGEVEVGLKQGSFGFDLKQSVLQPQQEELYGVVFGSSAGDDSFVDQFLNLQNADNPQEVDHHLENQQINSKNSAFLPLPPSPPLHPTAAAEDDLCGVLTLPEEEPELEWLSQFMEDSFSLPYPTAAGIPAPPENETAKSPACFSAAAALPRSRRSKRRRSDFLARGPVWSISPSSATESTTSSSSSSSATSPPWPPTSPSTPLALHSLASNPNKKRKNRASYGPGSGSAGLARRCSHCGSQKTPQWRAGPNGAKTLCNACGVRFKSGRLLPEYRPASSPSFSSDVHSNSHRKVIEMRRKKEMTGQPELGSDSALTTFG